MSKTATSTPKPIDNPVSLSVVLSIYNGEEFVADAVECILNQTYTDFELILINDGSKDGSLAIMQDYAAKDARIRIIDQENTGLTIALRRGVDAAKGEYIARMDADDVSLPQRFEKQMALLNANPELIAVTCDVEHFYDDGTPSHVARIRKDARVLPLYLVFSNRIGGHGQMIYRRDAYYAAGGYDPDFNYAEDYDLWTRLIAHGPFGIVPETLYRYRTGHDSISSRNAVRQAEVAGRVCRRQYEAMTGEVMDEETSRAMRVFWMNYSLNQITPAQMARVSNVMDRAASAFFAKNPALKSLEYETRQGIAAKWWWRRDHVGWSDLPRKMAVLTNVGRWGMKAVAARVFAG